jgi:hypothetical protein
MQTSNWFSQYLPPGKSNNLARILRQCGNEFEFTASSEFGSLAFLRKAGIGTACAIEPGFARIFKVNAWEKDLQIGPE